MNTATRSSSAPDALRARLLESLSTAVLLLDEQLCVLYANPAAEQLLASSLAQLKQQSISIFFESAAWHTASLLHTLTTQQSYIQREARLHRPGTAQSTMVDYIVTPLSSAQLLIEFQPLDRLMRMSREGSLSVANQATRAVVRGMAHEIKNPLSGIRGAAQLLARELDRTELREYTEVIINEADRLRALADRLLGARKPPDFKRINIH
ncbi:MAG: PAS domain-containing protein, partial [Alcaligenaceae bacterium]|nr:PAS domain-containing protein [Alcaligenaceae bacterium]